MNKGTTSCYLLSAGQVLDGPPWPCLARVISAAVYSDSNNYSSISESAKTLYSISLSVTLSALIFWYAIFSVGNGACLQYKRGQQEHFLEPLCGDIQADSL